MSERRKTIWDDFLYFDPKSNRLIRRCRDYATNGVWYFHFINGDESWWNTSKTPPAHWELIDRLPEKTL